MPITRHLRHTLTTLGILTLFTLGTLAFLQSSPTLRSLPIDPQSTPSELRTYWKGEMTSNGSSRTIAAALALASSSDARFQHSIGHALGDALYDVHGIDALTLCHGNFLFGCDHQVIARTITENGTASIATLVQTCSHDQSGKPTFGCTHGIGHGLLGYYGYTEPGLVHALQQCPPEADEATLFGCIQGVFMEYDLRKMSTEETPRPFTTDADPCARLESRFNLACHFTKALWWIEATRTASTSTETLYAAAGHFCSTLSGSRAEKNACFGGIGYATAPESKYLPADAAKLCTYAAPDGTAHRLCAACAAHALRNTGSRDASRILCRSADGGVDPLCVQLTCTAQEFERL